MTAAEITELEALRIGYQKIIQARDGMCEIQTLGMKRLIELERRDAARSVRILSCGYCNDPVTDALATPVLGADGSTSHLCPGCAIADQPAWMDALDRSEKALSAGAVPDTDVVRFDEIGMGVCYEIGGRVTGNRDAMMRAIDQAGNELFGSTK